MKLIDARQHLLVAMTNGHVLKVHRDLEGHKAYRLHTLDRAVETIEREIVAELIDRGLIDSNKKFPAATFWLTDAGRRALSLHA